MKRKAFTLIELLVVIGIIVLMAGILILTINHARRTAAITGEKLDFQTIATALENYRNDFGDYPRNRILPTWSGLNPQTPSPTTPAPAPEFITLASALLGPGSVTTQTMTIAGQTVTISGDGCNGPGARTRALPFSAMLSNSVAADASTITVSNVPSQWLSTNPNWQTVLAMSFVTLSAGQWNQEDVGIDATKSGPFVAGSGSYTLTLTAGTANPHPASMSPPKDPWPMLKIATGKLWPAYLPADKFQVGWIDPTRAATVGGTYVADVATNIHEPVLLDRWGSPIQYFPRYGPNTNRTSDSSYTAANAPALGLPSGLPTNINVGPLFGYSAPVSVDTTPPTSLSQPYGSNCVWDQRDGVPVLQTLGSSDTAIWRVYTWQGNGTPPPPSGPGSADPQDVDLSMAVKWMLGDENIDNFISDYTDGSGMAHHETLHYDGPYILISAGPDGPNRYAGGFCNFRQYYYNPEKWQKVMTDSGNIYNFDR